MARRPRVVAIDTPHHVTQRGNARQFVFESDPDRLVYLDLLRQRCRLHRLSLLGFCLMSNHVHLVVIPRRADHHDRFASRTLESSLDPRSFFLTW
jgi:putative transposase